ncbi:MAG: T9SS type A sorting domain-containing protein [Chryseobacterium sp.]|uniref:T9SS type A sorting domain-containing protein n=1 Tax=Chryseobacterium sp. TaxID=1871047 RepID=UPI0025C7364B|nr:T9SS type A sorting domain-containing protein [Chryseobacterium sp.]MCJ7932358.1 T9SS type A sorting domain-containing protein [Chryseobacterium sp.]
MNKILFLFCGLSYALTAAQTAFPQDIVIDDSYGVIRPNKVISVDFDNDGKTDILTNSTTYYTKIVWLRNDQINNGFRHAQTLYTHTDTIVDFDAKDVTGDGITDIIFSTATGLFMLKGTAAGPNPAFTAPITIIDVKVPVFQVVDVDGDGYQDIYWHQSNGTFWRKNDGTGNFTVSKKVLASPPEISFMKDLDHDNKPDLIKKSGFDVEWHKNDGTGTFTFKQKILGVAGLQLQTGDVDADGDTDLIYVYDNVGTQIRWFKNLNGSGNFSTEQIMSNIPYNPANIENYIPDRYKLKMLDVDNDGKQDVVFSVYWDKKLYWKKNLGNGAFGPDQLITDAVRGVISFDIGDFNQDTKKDIAVASFLDNRIGWYQNTTGSGNFGPEKIITESIDGLNKISTGDIDGDGDHDLLASSAADGKLTWYQNTNGQGAFSGMQKIIAKGLYSVTDAALVDMDGDGDKDVVVNYREVINANLTHHKIVWYENAGGGNFTTQHVVVGDQTIDILRIACADFDNDGDVDIVSASRDNRIAWFKNDGTGNFGPAQTFTVPVSGKTVLGIRIDDFDGDGDKDILISYNNDEIVWHENADGLGAFTTRHLVIHDMHCPMDIYSEDMDNDGDKDILFVNYYQNEVGWFENLDGLGNYGPKKVVASGTMNYMVHPRSVFAKDMDGDGLKDLLTTSNVAPKFRWYKNNGNKTFDGTPRLISNNIGRVASMEASDLNGDGVSELIAGCEKGEALLTDRPNMITWFETYTAFQNKTKGKIRYDIDNNGCDANDTAASMIMVSTQNANNTYSTFTNGNGEYTIIAGQGQYTTFVDTSLPNYTVNPQNHSYTFTSTGVTDIADFCIAPNQVYKDLEVSIYPVLAARPGFDTKYRMVVRNKGTQKVSGQISLAYNDAKMNFLQASSAVASQTNGNVSFNYQDFAPFQTKTIDLRFNVLPMPANNIGEQLHINGTAIVFGDVTPADNEFSLRQTVVGSYDPNDITVLEGSQIPLQDAGEYLHYIIRFQNTGNHFAEKVRIHNILDAKLDWSTLSLESYSHPSEVKIINGNDVEFNFNAIYLPGTNDEPNSHGYIAYKIKPKANVQVNDIVHNVADIYFDYNPAVVTNTVSTKIIDQMLGTKEQVKNTVHIYPNPTAGIIHLNTGSVPEKVEVYNALGQKVKTFRNASRVDLSDLAAGVYMLNVTSKKDGLTAVKVLKK